MTYVHLFGPASNRTVKNPAYGRQSISLPMRIVAPIPQSQVSTHVALDHKTYSALAQHTQITWTTGLNVMSLQGWEGGGWVTLYINPTFM